MTYTPTKGHDGPYSAPIVVQNRTVEPDWIDYNGHMNVGYYAIAFDKASDVFLEDHIGIDEAMIDALKQGPFILQTHQHFLQEMMLGDTFSVCFRLIDFDSKRLHYFGEMVSDRSGEVTATQEAVMMNVDHTTRRGAAYPDWVLRRLERMKADHAGLQPPTQQGAALGLRKG